MRTRLTILLAGGFAVAACSPSAEAVPQSGAIGRFTNQIERRNADEKGRAIEAADARAATRAETAKRRIAESERRRRRDGEGATPAG